MQPVGENETLPGRRIVTLFPKQANGQPRAFTESEVKRITDEIKSFGLSDLIVSSDLIVTRIGRRTGELKISIKGSMDQVRKYLSVGSLLRKNDGLTIGDETGRETKNSQSTETAYFNWKSSPDALKAIADATGRLFESTEIRPYLQIFVNSAASNDALPAFVGLCRDAAVTYCDLGFTHHQLKNVEPAVCGFFSDRGIPVRRAIGSITPYTPRHVDFALAGSSQDVACLVRDLLQVCFGIGEASILKLTFIRA